MDYMKLEKYTIPLTYSPSPQQQQQQMDVHEPTPFPQQHQTSDFLQLLSESDKSLKDDDFKQSLTLVNNLIECRVECEESSDTNSNLESFMSMSSMQDESYNRFEVPQRILAKLNFPQQPNPVFPYENNPLRMS